MKKILFDIYNFFISNRKCGTTTLLVKIAKENDVWVIVPDKKTGEQFGEKAITFSDLVRSKGITPKPILVDNFTMLEICEKFHNNMVELEAEKRSRDVLIDEIEGAINNFRSYNKRKAFNYDIVRKDRNNFKI